MRIKATSFPTHTKEELSYMQKADPTIKEFLEKRERRRERHETYPWGEEKTSSPVCLPVTTVGLMYRIALFQNHVVFCFTTGQL